MASARTALSRRQAQIAELIVHGKSNREIAGTLHLSARTVESHVAAIFYKLNVRSRTELVAAVLSATSAEFTNERSKTNLPLEMNRLIGREAEVSHLTGLLSTERLVTITGAGGVGKTRVGLRTAGLAVDACPAGVWLVELAALAHPALVAPRIASVLGINVAPNAEALAVLAGRLKRQRLLLVLDNCEHLVGEVARITDMLLQRCAHLRILATSREPLKIAGERSFRLPSLRFPDALALFAERAQAVDGGFSLSDQNEPLVTEICRRLDGIPLAIELAAANVNVLPISAIAEELDNRFAILTTGRRTALPRHQTMRALIDWSYDLLPVPEKRVFERLAAFVGGCTLPAATSVCAGRGVHQESMFSLLCTLVEKSLIVADVGGSQTCYRFSESVWEYAREKLVASGELEIVQRRHALALLELAERLEREFESTSERTWLTVAKPEIGDWRVALSWALVRRRDIIVGQRLAGALRLLFGRIDPLEGLRWVRLAIEFVDDRSPREISAKLDSAEASLASVLRQDRAALAAAERACASFRELGDGVKSAFAQTIAASSLVNLGEIDAGDALLRDALVVARASGNRRLLAFVLARASYVASLRNDVTEARALYEEQHRLWKALSAEGAAAITATNFAEFEFQNGNPEGALRLASDALIAHRALSQTHNVVEDLLSIAAFLNALSDYERALKCAREAFDLAHDLGLEVLFAIALQRMAAIALFRQTENVALTITRQTHAAMLLGFIDAGLAKLEFQRHYIEQQERERMLEVLCSELGADELHKLLAAGASMTESGAVDMAALLRFEGRGHGTAAM